MQIKLTPPPHHHTIYTAELDEPNKSGKLSKTVAFTTTVRSIPLYSANVRRDFEDYIDRLIAVGWERVA